MATSKKSASEEKGSGAKIVLAEDDKFLLQILYDKLTREGFDVTKANNGVEALDRIKKVKPDLVLLDLIMPLKNGFDVLEDLKKQGIKATVIVLSNLGQESDIKKAKSLGAVDYMIKSENSIKVIIEKVREFLGKK